MLLNCGPGEDSLESSELKEKGSNGLLTALVVYFSKQLAQTAKQWPHCLWAVTAITTLLKEAES